MNSTILCSLRSIVRVGFTRFKHNGRKRYPDSFINYMNKLHEPVSQDWDHEKVELGEDDMERYNAMAQETINMVDRRQHAIAWSRARRRMQKGPREFNILTIEQKRRLIHLANDPDDPWPLDRLANNFQISVESVKKLITSAWLPTDPDAIEKHDRLVNERRKQMGLPITQPSTPATPIDKKLNDKFGFTSLGALPAASHRANSLTRIVMSAADLAKASGGAVVDGNRENQVPTVDSRKPAVRMSSVYSRRERVKLSALPVDKEGHLTRLDIDVNLPRRSMTLKQLKECVEKKERASRLEIPCRANRPLT